MGSAMNWSSRASILCYILFLLFTITFSVIYLFRQEFMPWHVAIVEHDWAEIAPGIQSLILGLMKALGGAW